MNLASCFRQLSRVGFLALTIPLLAPASGFGEIIPAGRRINWKPGIPGGIPNRTVIFANVKNAPYNAVGDGIADDRAAIQSAINACPAGQVVFIPAGTYRVSGLLAMKSYVTLRGAGPSQTTILADHSGGATIEFSGGFGVTTVNIVSGYTAGSTSITLASPPQYLQTNDIIFLNQLNDGALVTPYGWESGSPSLCGYCSVNGENGDRSLAQGVTVTGVSGSTVQFDPPLYWTFSNSLAPRMDYNQNGGNGNSGRWMGVEDLKLSRTDSASPNHVLSLYYASCCWVKNVEVHRGGGRGGIYTYRVLRCEFRDMFFNQADGAQAASGEGVIIFPSTSDCLVENNIFNEIRNPISLNGPSMGNVIAYNYITNLPNANQNILVSGITTHGAHPMFNLFEGNIVPKMHFDMIHGSASHNTVFRNFIRGRQEAINGVVNDSGMGCVWIDATNHFFNVVGNVLGYKGVNSDIANYLYDVESPNGAGFNGGGILYVWRFSYAGYSRALVDPKAKSTLLRHGNYDFFTSATNWDSTISDPFLPASLYLTNKPAWFGNLAWPPFGPENANNGSYTLTRATTIPAGYRFVNGVPPPPATADTNAPTTPTSALASAVGTTQINVSWSASTDNVGVTGYRVERSQGAGSLAYAQIAAPSGTSFSDTGLTPSTVYNYRIRAMDAAGNLSGYSSVATALTGTPAVNQPPTVSLISPSSGTSTFAPSTVAVAASASDSDGSVVLVEFFEGLNKIGEAASPPYQVAWQAGVPGDYILTAVAHDDASAVTLSSAVTVKVAQPGITSAQRLPNGSFSLAADGAVGRTNAVHISTDLVSWTLLTNVVNSSGVINIVDPEAAIVSRRFYRIWAESIFLSNVVGFAKVSVPPGYSIVANQFVPATNKVAVVLAGVPGGTTLSKFRPATGDFSINNYDPIFQSWLDPNQSFGSGDTGFILNPTTNAFNLVFQGQVPQGMLTLPLSTGYSMISSLVPQAGLVQAQLGFPGASGDTVFLYRNGRYRTSQYDPLLGGWDYEPNVNVGEGFFLFKTAATNWARAFSAFN